MYPCSRWYTYNCYIDITTISSNYVPENELLKIELDESEKFNEFLKNEVKDLMNIVNLKITTISPNICKTPKKDTPPPAIDFYLQMPFISNQSINTPDVNTFGNEKPSCDYNISDTPTINSSLATPPSKNRTLPGNVLAILLIKSLQESVNR